MLNIDINCDLGESFGAYTIGNDEEVLKFVSSVNVACGYHAGDPLVMEKTVKMALEKGVAIGAHPGYPDLMGFGRRNLSISPEEARSYMIYQIGALKGFVEAYGGKLQHVKPHGALYNTAAVDYGLARAVAEAVYSIDSELIFVGLANSMLTKAAKDVGLKAANEVFADRAYNKDGTLVSRKQPGAVIHDTDFCIDRVLQMIREKTVTAISGETVMIKADTICIHGDNSMALEFASSLSKAIISSQIAIKPLREVF